MKLGDVVYFGCNNEVRTTSGMNMPYDGCAYRVFKVVGYIARWTLARVHAQITSAKVSQRKMKMTPTVAATTLDETLAAAAAIKTVKAARPSL